MLAACLWSAPLAAAPVDRLVIGREPGNADTNLFENYVEMPIAAINAEVTVDPEVVAERPFPGVTAGGTSHWHLIVPAGGQPQGR